MKLCLNTLMWHDRPLYEALEAARATGIRHLELGATLPHQHFRPGDGPAAAKALAAQLRDWSIAAVTADRPDMPRSREEGGAGAVAYTVAAMRCAGELGA